MSGDESRAAERAAREAAADAREAAAQAKRASDELRKNLEVRDAGRGGEGTGSGEARD